MTKELNKVSMKRSGLRNKFLKKYDLMQGVAYNKQRNYCVNLLRRTKKTHFANINIDLVSDNKKMGNCQTTLVSQYLLQGSNKVSSN